LSRRHCRTLLPGVFLKDLSCVGSPLARTVLVDDTSSSFLLQPDNGVPVASYSGADPADGALAALIPLLASLSRTAADVRPRLRELFALEQKLDRAPLVGSSRPLDLSLGRHPM
jgi:TFIIF-interacting CTD phosphatase-like protein